MTEGGIPGPLEAFSVVTPIRLIDSPTPIDLETAVKYVNLGSTGLRVSRVCLGMMSFGNDSERPWVLDEDAAEPIAKAQHAADTHGWTRFVSMQNHYNLLYREEEREMIPQCIDQGVAVIPWSPLARGVLAGSRTRDGERRTTRSSTDSFVDTLYGDADFDVVDRAAEVAAERGVPQAQVALAWLMRRPGVTTPIVGATRLGHLQDALAAEELELSDEEMRRLEELYVPHPVLGHG